MIMRFAEPMAMFISYTSVVELIASALQRIEQFMAIAPLPVAEQSEMPERYDIRFDNVSYRYEEGDGHALNHVSLTFRQPRRARWWVPPAQAKLRSPNC